MTTAATTLKMDLVLEINFMSIMLMCLDFCC